MIDAAVEDRLVDSPFIDSSGDAPDAPGDVSEEMRRSCIDLGRCDAFERVEAPPYSVIFGSDLALSGDGTVLIVADANGGDFARGSVTLHQYRSGRFEQVRNIAAPPGSIDFGFEVDISDEANAVVVGDANGGIEGLVTVLRLAEGAMPTTLVTPRGSADFGYSVSLSADGVRLAVGDPGAGPTGAGAAFVYVYRDGAYQLEATLPAPAGSYQFGAALDFSADASVLAVGDPNGGRNNWGQVTIYTRTGTNWNDGEPMTTPPLSQRFGQRVALSAGGDTLVVGDPQGGPYPAGARVKLGAATVFRRAQGQWQQGLALPAPAHTRSMGGSLGVSRDVMAVGHRSEDGRGGLLIYRFGDGMWRFEMELVRPESTNFGTTVSVSEDASRLAVGDYLIVRENPSASVGEVFVYDLETR